MKIRYGILFLVRLLVMYKEKTQSFINPSWGEDTNISLAQLRDIFNCETENLLSVKELLMKVATRGPAGEEVGPHHSLTLKLTSLIIIFLSFIVGLAIFGGKSTTPHLTTKTTFGGEIGQYFYFGLFSLVGTVVWQRAAWGQVSITTVNFQSPSNWTPLFITMAAMRPHFPKGQQGARERMWDSKSEGEGKRVL